MLASNWNRYQAFWQEWQPLWRWTSMGKSQTSAQWSWWWSACGSTTRPMALTRGYVWHDWKLFPDSRSSCPWIHIQIRELINVCLYGWCVSSLQRRRFLCGTSWMSLAQKCSTQTSQAVAWLLSSIFRISWLTHYSGLCRTCRRKVNAWLHTRYTSMMLSTIHIQGCERTLKSWSARPHCHNSDITLCCHDSILMPQ